MSLTYTIAAFANLINPKKIKIIEHRSQNSTFHAFQFSILELDGDYREENPNAKVPDFLEKAEILKEAKTKLENSGYQVQVRDGYKGKKGWVSWPHLQIVANDGNSNKQLMDQLAAQSALNQQIMMVLAASLGGDNPQIQALVQQMATGTMPTTTTEPVTETTAEAEVVEEEESF